MDCDQGFRNRFALDNDSDRLLPCRHDDHFRFIDIKRGGQFYSVKASQFSMLTLSFEKELIVYCGFWNYSFIVYLLIRSPTHPVDDPSAGRFICTMPTMFNIEELITDKIRCRVILEHNSEKVRKILRRFDEHFGLKVGNA